MGSIRDPGAADTAAQELARARLSVAQEARQKAARRARERRVAGSPAARRALAEDFAPVSDLEAARAQRR